MKSGAMKRTLLLLATALIVGVGGLKLSRLHRIKNEFQAATKGTTANEMSAQLGTPWRSGKCGSSLGDMQASGCEKEFVYAHPLAPIVPQYWAFFYDGDGRLIDKYEYDSP